MAMKANLNVTRMNIRISKKIRKYFEEKSEETGVPQSHLMALALEEYVDQKEVIRFTSSGEVQKIIDNLKKEVKNE
jgi:predicted DNA-binding protein